MELGVAAVGAGQRLQQQGGVGHGAAHGARLREMVGRGTPIAAVARNAMLGRLDAEDAAEAGRYAYGAAAVAAGGDGAKAGGQGSARAAAGPAGGAASVPRVPAGIADLVLGGARLPELRRIGLAQHDSPSGLDPLDDDRVYLRSPVAEQGRSHGAGQTLGQFQVFDGDGYAVQRPHGPAAGHGVIGGAGVGHCFFGAQRQIGVKLRVQPLDALEEMLGNFRRRHLP